jgi:hypothetical protein
MIKGKIERKIKFGNMLFSSLRQLNALIYKQKLREHKKKIK